MDKLMKIFYRNTFHEDPNFTSNYQNTDSFYLSFETFEPDDYLMWLRNYLGTNLMKGKISKSNPAEKMLNRLYHIFYINNSCDIFKLIKIEREGMRDHKTTLVSLKYVKIEGKELQKFVKAHQITLLLNNL